MKKIFTIGVFLFLCNHAKAQSAGTDSLKILLATTTEDTSRVLLLEDLSFSYQYSYPDTALHYAMQGLQLARRIGYPKGEGYCLNALGNVYLDIGNYPRALELYLDALKIREKLKGQREIAVTYSNIGTVYSEQGDHRQALNYISKTKQVDEAIKDSTGLMIDLYNIGSLYQNLDMPDSALFYQEIAYHIAGLIHDHDYIGAIATAFGVAYKSMNNFPVAIEFFRRGITYADIVSDRQVISKAYYGLAEIFRGQRSSDSAIANATQALSSARQASFLKDVMQASLLLSDLFKEESRFDSALYYHELAMATKDSLFNVEKTKQIENLAYNEQLRQQELSEEKIRAQKERADSLQLIGIAVFIVSFLFVLMLLGRREKHPRAVEFLALFALFLLFEFVSFLVHPYLSRITHETPVYYLTVSVLLAASLTRLHERTTGLITRKVLHKPADPVHHH
ncbi:MAG TPA: tetratricopeptide repeat protein [Parafilimonas sp.]|nr:tetratricopeptide repeat protein [Parafilimonas sp.]